MFTWKKKDKQLNILKKEMVQRRYWEEGQGVFSTAKKRQYALATSKKKCRAWCPLKNVKW